MPAYRLSNSGDTRYYDNGMMAPSSGYYGDPMSPREYATYRDSDLTPEEIEKLRQEYLLELRRRQSRDVFSETERERGHRMPEPPRMGADAQQQLKTDFYLKKMFPAAFVELPEDTVQRRLDIPVEERQEIKRDPMSGELSLANHPVGMVQVEGKDPVYWTEETNPEYTQAKALKDRAESELAQYIASGALEGKASRAGDSRTLRLTDPERNSLYKEIAPKLAEIQTKTLAGANATDLERSGYVNLLREAQARQFDPAEAQVMDELRRQNRYEDFGTSATQIENKELMAGKKPASESGSSLPPGLMAEARKLYEKRRASNPNDRRTIEDAIATIKQFARL
jgi:hypothetical protein